MNKDQGRIQDYPCKCSGGDMCYIVHHPKLSVSVSYPTREEAERELKKLNRKKKSRGRKIPEKTAELQGEPE